MPTIAGRLMSIFALAAAGCTAGGSDAPSVDPSRLTPAGFSGGGAPQLDLGGPDLNWTWNDPHVLKTGAGYVMYASATDNFVFPVRSYRLVSTDGEAWSRDPAGPVLADSAPGSWDAGGIETPAVVFFGGKYHLFYTSYPYMVGDPLHEALDYRFGHAVSDDGISFTRVTAAPILEPSGTDADPSNDWFAFIVAEPGPVVVNGEIYLYFTAVGADADLGASLQVIGLIRSSDGVTWSEPVPALKPDQVLYPRDDDWIGYSTPNAIVLGDGVHLFFDVASQPDGGDWKQLRLHHARSADGISGWIHDPEAIGSAGDFPWAVDEIRSPHALLDGGILRLYFAGHDFSGSPPHFGIGMLTCDLSAE